MTAEIFGSGTVALEKGLIGAILVRNEILADLPWLEVGHFAHLPCAVAWRAIRNLEDGNKPIDVVTVEAELERAGDLEAVNIADLGSWIASFPSADNAVEYAAEIREHALHRRILLLAGDLVTRGAKRAVFGSDLLSEFLAAITNLDASEIKDETQQISELTREHIKHLETEAARRLAGKVELIGFPTGVAMLDAEIGGWQPGIVSVICARPGHGKSSLGLATADAASERGIGVHVFSLEDPRRMYMNRVLARLSGIPINRISTADLQRSDLIDFTRAQHQLVKIGRPWIVDDRSGIAADEIVRSVRRHRKENGTRVVIVDYLQLVKRNRFSNAKSRHEQIGETLHELADAAKNDGMAYVVMSQLNRGVESREDKRPVESDLRESGTIEERAKTIVGLYRGRRYSPTPQPDVDIDHEGHLMDPHTFERSVQLLVIKNSQGPAPVRILANWHGETTRIS